jgi:hypothetical protein
MHELLTRAESNSAFKLSYRLSMAKIKAIVYTINEINIECCLKSGQEDIAIKVQ